MVGPTPHTQSPSGLVGGVPADDAGAETLDRYAWQEHCTTLLSVSMLEDDGPDRVVCEVHEDVLLVRSEVFELVNCKHREPRLGPWSILHLTEASLGHLFRTWRTAKPGTKCRVMTNAALDPQCARLAEICEGLSTGSTPPAPWGEEEIRQLALALIRNRKSTDSEIPNTTFHWNRRNNVVIPEPFLQLVRQFAGSLSFQHELPQRHEVEPVFKDRCRRTVEQATPGVDAAHLYDRIFETVARKSKLSPRVELFMQITAGSTQLEPGSEEAYLQTRQITRDTILDLADSMRTVEKAGPAPEKILYAKLGATSTSANAVQKALRRRLYWREYSRTLDPHTLGDLSRVETLEDHVSDLAIQVENIVTPDFTNVLEFLTELEREIEIAFADSGTDFVRAVKGLAIDMASRCEVWFTPMFDVESVLADVEEEAS